MEWGVFWRTVLGWTGLTLVHATALAFLTWLLCATLLRRARPALPAALWTVVLIKFLVPPVLPVNVGLSGWLSAALGRWTSVQHAVTPGEIPEWSAGNIPLGVTSQDFTSLAAWLSGSELVTGLGFLYLLVLIWVTGRTISRSWKTWKWVHRLPLAPIELTQQVYELARDLGVRRLPVVKTTRGMESPSVVGFWKATLIFPEKVLSGLGEQEKKALMIHELAHLRRGDLWVRWLQNLTRTLLFFWPPVWWVCRRIERFAEMACDEWAVARSGLRPDLYAHSLLEVVKSLALNPVGRHELAFARDGRLMEERFQMILKCGDKRSHKLSVVMVPALAGWLLFAFGGSVTGQEPVTVKEVKKIKIVLEGDGTAVLPGDLLREHPEADLNGDGTLMAQELKQFLESNPNAFDGNVVILKGEPGHHAVHVKRHVLHEVDETAHLSELLERHPDADKNGDGQLDKSELDAWMEAQGGRKIMIRVEHPGDHVAIQGYGEDPELHHERKIHIAVENLEGLLEKYPEADLDGDGSLSEEELSEFARTRMSHGEAHEVKADTMVFIAEAEPGEAQDFSWTSEDGKQVRLKLQGVSEAVDLDGDGAVTEAEVELFLETIQESEGHGLQHVTVDVIQDRAGIQQKLNEGEMRAVREKMAVERRRQLLQKYPDADVDGDGVLSKAEVEELVARLNADRAKSETRKKPN